MKKIYPLVVLALCSLLIGCNGIGSKDTVVARIGNETLYQEDLDFLALQNGVDLNSESGKNAVDALLFSLAKVSAATAESDSYDSSWKSYESVLNKRLLAFAYAQYHLVLRLGYSDDELKKYFEDHRDEFDSAVTYLQVRKKVADRYYLSKNQDSLKKFIREHLSEKNEPPKVEILFFEGDSLAVSEMERVFNSGVSCDSMPAVHRAAIVQGREQGIFADSSVIRALFLADSMAVGTGRSFRVKENSSFTFFALKVLNRLPAVYAQEAEYKEDFEKVFVMQHRESMIGKIRGMQADLGDVVIEKLAPKDPHKFYEDNKDKFMTVPGYEVYHVAMKDSAVLTKTMAYVKDLESFKAMAATISENMETSENNGFVGRIKKNFALPYGIGMMPALWPELEGKQVGYISSAILSQSDSLYHCFYVSEIIPSEAKSFDRVEKQIGEMYANDVNSLDSATVLISKNGTPLYTKADLLKVFNSEPEMPYNVETHRNVVMMLAQSYVLAEKAMQENVDRSWEFRAIMRKARMNFVVASYDRTHKSDVPVSQPISEDLKKFEYFYNESRVYKGKTYDEALPQVIATLEARSQGHQKELADMQLWNRTNVFFYDHSKGNLAPLTTAEKILAKADSAAQNQKFNEAIAAYQKMMVLFADRDSLFRTVVYNLAQVYSDAQRFEESAGCYSVFLKVWPDAPEAEKAMFSLGFILNENLKQNDRALEVLEDFQKRFPKSELKESVDWLVENIKSDGKLAEDLMKKIEAEE